MPANYATILAAFEKAKAESERAALVQELKARTAAAAEQTPTDTANEAAAETTTDDGPTQ